MSEIIKESLDGIKGFASTDAIIGKTIKTDSGVSIIPISKMTVGFIGGGVDYGQKKLAQNQNFGGGSGAAVSITPIALLAIKDDSTVNLIPIEKDKNGSDKIFSVLERTPEIIGKIKSSMS